MPHVLLVSTSFRAGPNLSRPSHIQALQYIARFVPVGCKVQGARIQATFVLGALSFDQHLSEQQNKQVQSVVRNNPLHFLRRNTGQISERILCLYPQRQQTAVTGSLAGCNMCKFRQSSLVSHRASGSSCSQKSHHHTLNAYVQHAQHVCFPVQTSKPCEMGSPRFEKSTRTSPEPVREEHDEIRDVSTRYPQLDTMDTVTSKYTIRMMLSG